MINQRLADEHFDRPSMDVCATCGREFTSDDGMINASHEECATCAQIRSDNDALAIEFGDAVNHGMGRDIESDDLREMFDRGLSVHDAIVELISGDVDRLHADAVDRVMRG